MSDYIYCSSCERQSKINTILLNTDNGIEFIDDNIENNWIVRDNNKINYMMKIYDDYYCYSCMHSSLDNYNTEFDAECSICLSGIKNTDIYTTPCCNHNLHTNCINTWFLEHTSCPLCRTDINPNTSHFVIQDMYEDMIIIQ